MRRLKMPIHSGMEATELRFPARDPSSMTVTPNAWLRNPRRTRAMAAAAAFISVCGFGIVLVPLFPTCPEEYQTTAGHLKLGAVGFAWGTPALILALRTATSGLWIGFTEIVIRSPLRTRRIPISTVAAFVPGFTAGFNEGVPCPVLTSTEGDLFEVWALGRDKTTPASTRRAVPFTERKREFPEHLQPICDELNGLLISLGHGPATPSPQSGPSAES